MQENLLTEYNQYIEELTSKASPNEDPLNFINFVFLPTFEEWKEMNFGKAVLA